MVEPEIGLVGEVDLMQATVHRQVDPRGQPLDHGIDLGGAELPGLPVHRDPGIAAVDHLAQVSQIARQAILERHAMAARAIVGLVADLGQLIDGVEQEPRRLGKGL